MRRRAFIALIAGAMAAAWPLAARGEVTRRLGLLFITSAQAAKARGLLESIIQGLKEHGWIEGQNFTFEYRFADGKQDALPKLAAELVQLRVDAIVTDSSPAIQAAKNATQTVPIVGIGNDLVGSGFVQSLSRPGGNITGISLLSADLAGRRLQLLSEMVPGLARVAVLSNPANPSHFALVQQTQAAALLLKIEIHVAEAGAPDLLESAFAAISAAQTGALIVLPDVMFFGQYPRVVEFAATARLPALFLEKQVVEGGGLMAYGPSIPAAYRGLAAYVDKIFHGANPAELPVEQPTTLEFAINLKTAKTLGLVVPDKLLSTADEVIE
jgi:putative tryptophan/tyrosine transport system substrate-binding protein